MSDAARYSDDTLQDLMSAKLGEFSNFWLAVIKRGLKWQQ